MKTLNLTLAMIAGLSVGSAAFAQTAFDGTDTATDRNEDLREAIDDDFDTAPEAVGNEGRKLGFSGSVALRASAASGNADTVDLGVGAEMAYFDGTNGYSLEVNYDYAEDSGAATEESLFFDAQYTRDFNPRFYGFAKVQGTVDAFSSYESDYFVGVGAGYRVFDNAKTRWTVQGGPGYRVASLTDVVDGEFDEAAFALSSNYRQQLSETVYFINDTDIITSESDTSVINDLGLTVAVANNLAIKTSIQTEFHTDPLDGYEDTDNTFGVSLVYNY
ncbi:DUF481 domain-containing protein [Celeribacter arenosi]|uniref:DUF481 domain-containing protein n=1 Tax=Celeribacter arenosi TaxID=792649 RepID=A0ABP7K5B7_9RHOB